MTNYLYDPLSGQCTADGFTEVPLSTLTGADVLNVATGENGAFSPGPYTIQLPPGFTAASINCTDYNATIYVPSGVTVNTNISIVDGGGNIQLGDSNSNATATLNGGFSIYNSGSSVNVTGNVLVTQSSGVTLANIYVAAGATFTVEGVLEANTIITNPNVGGGHINLGSGSTLNVTTPLTGAEASNIVNQTTVAPSSPGNAKLNLGAVNNAGNTLNLTGKTKLEINTPSVTGGTLVTGQDTMINTGVALTNVNLEGIYNTPSASATSGTTTFTNVTGDATNNDNGSDAFDGDVGDPEDALTFNIFGGGGITDFNPATFEPRTVLNVQTSSFLSTNLSFYAQTTLQGRLDVGGGGLGATITELGALEFASGSGVEIDKNTLLVINALSFPGVPQIGVDNETTIRLAGGTLRLEGAPTALGTIQFYTGNSTLTEGAASASSAFSLSGTLEDFSDSDAVIFNGATFGANAMATLTGNILSVVDQNGVLDGTFTLTSDDAQTYVQNDFTLAAVTGGMKLVTNGVSVLAAPVVTGDTFFQVHNFFAPGPAVLADPSVTVSDTGASTLAGATVAITTGFAQGDTLGLAEQNGITGAYDAAAGVLSLSGTATISQYQQALDSVTYGFTPGGDPTLGGGLTTRTLSWSVNDGKVTSLPATTTVTENFTAPVLNFTGTVAYDSRQAPVVLDSAVTLTDPNTTTLTGATVSVDVGAAGDLLTAVTAGTSITAAYDGTAQASTLSGTDTIANYVTVLDTVAFSSTATDPSSGGAAPEREFDVSVTDSGGNTATGAAFATVTCFVRGTRIATVKGKAGVEELRPGDRVWTREGVLAPII